jgi:hypothetical protein
MVGVDWDGIEREVELIYRCAGRDASLGAPTLEIAQAVLGARSVVFVSPDWLPAAGALVRVGSERRIYVRRGLPANRLAFVLGHETAHYVLGPDASEDLCDHLAGALIAPRAAYLRALSGKFSPTRIAKRFGMDQSFVWLRKGEVTAEPVALVAPYRVRTRGAAYSWPAEPALRELAKAHHLPGLRKAVLRDDTERVVLCVA